MLRYILLLPYILIYTSLYGQSNFINSNPDTLQGIIKDVKDGDTYVFLSKNRNKYTCRIRYIDAPEKKQPAGMLCKNKLTNLLLGKNVSILVYGIDMYGRFVTDIYVNKDSNKDIGSYSTIEGTIKAIDEEDVHNEYLSYYLARRGYAWVYPEFCKEEKYYKAEELARASAKNIWNINYYSKGERPIAPWIYRANK